MIDALSLFTARIAPTDVQRVDTLPRSQTPDAEVSDGPSFGQILDQVSRDAVQSLRGAESMSIAALQGEATTLEVVDAIKSAEQALQTATAVRDKIVQAYQEISRMPI